MPLPDSYLQHHHEQGYHPRSNKHSDALATAIVHDLIRACPPLASQAAQGRLVYQLNMDVRQANSTWNTDLAIGTPASAVDSKGEVIVRATPATIRIAIELKGVMTEHRKAIKNRKRDFEAHHGHVHDYSHRAIAGGVLTVNAAASFRSPLRAESTFHGDRQAVVRLVEHCVTEMRNVTESGRNSPNGLDAKAVVVVDFDNVTFASGRYFTQPPAPQPGDPLHYDSFIQRICEEYSERFGRSG
jgi:hypothetical protein